MKRKDEPNYMQMYRNKVLKPKQNQRITNQIGWTKESQEGFYNSKEWEVIRDRRRLEDPLCVFCLAKGKLTAVKYVDHIIPVDERPELKLVYSNTQSTCDYHHKWKTAQDKARKNKARKKEKGKQLMNDLEN